nr:MAG TPA: hypothetical protein [Caudoviricetes sp.]
MKNISCKITFENQFNIAEDETKKNIKILMLKGEKGEKGDVKNLEWGKITGNITNQNDLKQMIDTNLTPYIKKDENNNINLEGNINVISNTTNPYPNNFDKSIKFSDKKTQNEFEIVPYFDEEFSKNMLKITFSNKTQKKLVRLNINAYGDIITSGAFITSNNSTNGAVQVHHAAQNTQAIVSAKRDDTNTKILLGVDSDGIKHGIYSSKLNKWIVEANDEESNFNGNWSGIKQSLETENTTSTWVPVINNGVLEHRVISSDLNNRGILEINDDSAHLKYNNKDTRVNFITAENLAFWNGAYESNNGSNLQYCKQGSIQAKPTILFDNSDGIQNDIVLNEDINKYERIIIYFKDSEMHLNNSIVVAKPFNKDVILSTLTPYDDGDIKIKTARYFLQNKLLKFKYSRITNIKSSGNVKYNSNQISVLRVEGYK